MCTTVPLTLPSVSLPASIHNLHALRPSAPWIAVLLLLALPSTLLARRGDPPPSRLRAVSPTHTISIVELPAIDIEHELAIDELNEKRFAPSPLRSSADRLKDWLDPTGQGDLMVDGADPAAAGGCEDAHGLTCGGSDFWGNGETGSTDNVDSYACAPSTDYTGPEYTYIFQPATSDSVTVNLTGLTADLDLLILQDSGNGCQPGDCFGSSVESGTSDESVTFQAVAGTTYFIVVDGYEGAVSDYSISLSCPEAGCTPSATNLCLLDGRFKVEVDWRDGNDNTGQGQVVPLGRFASSDSGLFYFFNQKNWEMLVKMVDTCNSPFNSFWVFSAATTDVEFSLRVTDTVTEAVSAYFNPLGQAAETITDTGAFVTCP